MADIFDTLLDNLEKQLKAMVKDEVDVVLSLVTEQEHLAEQLHQRLSSGEPLSKAQTEKARRIAMLVESNQLLAQQGLAFSKRMLKILGGGDTYNKEGLTTGQNIKSKRLDIRA